MDGTTTTLPPGTPLLAKAGQASEILGLSAKSLYRLRLTHPDFRALTIKTGREVLYDIPRCYAWFGLHLGSDLEISE